MARHALDPIPEDGLVFDFTYDIVKGRWVAWKTMMGSFKVPASASFSSILVPTLDTVRNTKLMQKLVMRGVNVLLTGGTGTGKTVQVKQLLGEVLDQKKFQPMFLNFSAQTSANMTQDIIDGKLGKRRKGVFGPPPGKRCVVFVDDLNMPKKEEYGAQPPIEILRQWMDHKGWYVARIARIARIALMVRDEGRSGGAKGQSGGTWRMVKCNAAAAFTVDSCIEALLREER